MCLILFGSYNALIAASANQKIVSRRGVLYGFKVDNALKYLIEKTNPETMLLYTLIPRCIIFLPI